MAWYVMFSFQVVSYVMPFPVQYLYCVSCLICHVMLFCKDALHSVLLHRFVMLSHVISNHRLHDGGGGGSGWRRSGRVRGRTRRLCVHSWRQHGPSAKTPASSCWQHSGRATSCGGMRRRCAERARRRREPHAKRCSAQLRMLTKLFFRMADVDAKKQLQFHIQVVKPDNCVRSSGAYRCDVYVYRVLHHDM